MAHVSKRIKAQLAKYDVLKSYPVEEAFKILKSTVSVKFDESVDVSINLCLPKATRPKRRRKPVRTSSAFRTWRTESSKARSISTSSLPRPRRCGSWARSARFWARAD